MTVSDNTIKAEGLSSFFLKFGKDFFKSRQEISKKRNK